VNVLSRIGGWQAGPLAPAFAGSELLEATGQVREPIAIVQHPESGQIGLGRGGDAVAPNGTPTWPLLATLPALYPEWLGDRAFTEVHRVRFPYAVGAMANGITTARMVIEAAQAGFLAFFGAAGLDPARISGELDTIEAALPAPAPGELGPAWGSNLIHAPNEPEHEEAVADLYIRRNVRRVSASAYMSLTPAIVRIACTGLRQMPDGRIHRDRFVFAKISRPEVARRFLAPAPADILDLLVQRGDLTAEEARLGRLVPVAEDYTVEADSGGHTDNQALTALFPTIQVERDRAVAKYGYRRPIRLGAAGGIGTPTAVAAAFALGAAFVLTGSVNQACIESGLHESGRRLLCNAGLADVVMAPAADMFELGVEVQVLHRGTMFGNRAKRLYQLYRANDSLESIPAADLARLEREVLGQTCDEAWTGTRAFWANRDAREVTKAERDPKHRMALVFRSYLGQSSKWAIAGNSERRMDYQVWCGPAMGAFNAWAAGSFLEAPGARTVAQVGRNLLEGAAVATRAHQLRSFGVPVPAEAFDFRPRRLV
jgi:trans-AT polyketide synthase, acyltransferase and oxidoreductase domains